MTLKQLIEELDIWILDCKMQLKTYESDLATNLEYQMLVLKEIQEQLHRLQDLES